MEKNPLNRGLISENFGGIGPVTRDMIHARARELALYSLGFVPRQTKVFQVQVQGGSPVHALLTRATAWKYMWSDGDLDQIL